MLWPDHKPAVFDDVRFASQAGRKHAQEWVHDGGDDDREDADLDRSLEQVLALEPVLLARETGGSLQERVFRVLRTAILEGRFPANQKITEQELSMALNISRTPLREAVRRLGAEGLVSPSPSRGVVVRGLSWQDLEDIYEIRAVLEPLAARRAATRIRAPALEALGQHLDLAEFFAAKDRYDEVDSQNHQFHQVIYGECANERLRKTLAGLNDYIHRSTLYRKHGPGSSHELLEEHRQLLQALTAHDGRAAERLARVHADRNRARVMLEPGDWNQSAAR